METPEDVAPTRNEDDEESRARELSLLTVFDYIRVIIVDGIWADEGWPKFIVFIFLSLQVGSQVLM